MLRTKTLCMKPRSLVFTGPDKYLRLQKVKMSHTIYPVMEDDSIFVYVRSGHGQITINGVVFDLKPGILCWLQYYHVFTIEPELGEELELDVCAYDYQLANYLVFSPRTISDTDGYMYSLPIIQLSEESDQYARMLLHEFEKESGSSDPGSALIKVSILGLLDSLFCMETIRTQNWVLEDAPLGWRAALYIAFYSSQPLEAAEVASLFGASTASLNHELKISVGLNFSQMLNRARIHTSMAAILFEGLSFSFLAAHSGFKSEIVFFRTFKKLNGVTPQEYRENITRGNHYIYRSTVMNEAYLSAINYIYTNFSEPISIKTMENDLYLSENVIRKLLMENIGMTYKDVVDMFRIRYAEALLVVTELPVVDVSVAAGFNSVRTFMRVFQDRNGLSPSAYRKKYQRWTVR